MPQAETVKSHFLKEHDQGYGYGGRIDRIREKEFPILKDQIYLDHAGATVPCASHLHALHTDLSTHLYGNSHSNSPSSQLTSHRIASMRARVLRFLGVDPGTGAYDVVFTANATAAIRTVGEGFPWREGSEYLCLREVHTSLLGVRECATGVPGTTVRMVTEEEVEGMFPRIEEDNRPNHHHHQHAPVNSDPAADADTEPKSLFAYPAQSNYSGTRFPLSWTTRCRRRHPNTHLVLLDAASYCSTSPLTLSPQSCDPDFVTLSFYKLFGLPTGLGALIVRPQAAALLRKRYFGGGTVAFITYDQPWHILKSSSPHARLEDGTLNFADIVSLDHAMNAWDRVFGAPGRFPSTFHAISAHVAPLTKLMVEQMRGLRHHNGLNVCELYAESKVGEKGEDGRSRQGPVVNFNLRRADGSWVGYAEVERLAGLEGVHLRTGGFCNPGSYQRWLGFSAKDMRANFEVGKTCGDDLDLLDGRPLGSVRISLGAMSTVDDVLRWLAFLEEYFVEKVALAVMESKDEMEKAEVVVVERKDETEKLEKLDKKAEKGMTVGELIIYPIKSCRGYPIPPTMSWHITPRGLQYDREWMIVHSNTGAALSQKRFPRMCLIRPRIDLETGYMIVEAPGLDSLMIPLSLATGIDDENVVNGPLCLSRVCEDSIPIIRYSDPKVTAWFTAAMDGIACTLARHPPDSAVSRFMKPHLLEGRKRDKDAEQTELSLSNESPFLLISERSVEDIRERIRERRVECGEEVEEEIEASGFRANIVVQGMERAYEEDGWKKIRIGEQVFKLLGPCRRCHMVCINQETAVKTKEPFVTLALHRRIKGQVLFGQHMMAEPSSGPGLVRAGDAVSVMQ